MSVRLKDRSKAPVRGFQFFQAETGFDLAKACPACQWSFDLAVKTLVKHRLGNPRFKLSTDPAAVAAELDLANALRMKSIPGAESYIIEDSSPIEFAPKSPALTALLGRAAVGAGLANKLGSGAAVLLEWLGDGGQPCPQEEAEARSGICAGCKWNEKGDWTRWFTVPISNGIRRELDKRGQMGLKTSHDDKLNVCSLCSCPIPLKVHTPMQYIQAHLPDLVKEDLRQNAPWCWIVKAAENA